MRRVAITGMGVVCPVGIGVDAMWDAVSAGRSGIGPITRFDASAFPSRVIKGKRLPGRMGGENLTIRNLKVFAVDAEQNLLLVRGAVPGPTNGLVFVKKREG